MGLVWCIPPLETILRMGPNPGGCARGTPLVAPMSRALWLDMPCKGVVVGPTMERKCDYT